MTDKIAIIGLGLIGRAWAISFAQTGANVALWDGIEGVAVASPEKIAPQVADLADKGLLNEPPEAVMARITPHTDVATALSGARHIQENTPEVLSVKRTVLKMIDASVDGNAVIASSTSGLLPSVMFDGLPGAHRCLVAHPMNPPYLIPAVELVPGPETSDATMLACRATLQGAGHTVITLKREIDGFVINRLQGALLDEAFRLVADGIADPEDVDIVLRDGLALRWSFMGPFETIDLNAPGGVEDYIARYGAMYERLAIGAQGRADWAGPVCEQVSADRRARLAVEDIPARSAWRDARLAALRVHKRSLETKG